MLVPNRHGSSNSYRYGFQGQEKDDELKGEGNSLNYTFRMHDPRVGRFFARDPLSKEYAFYSPYSFSGNKVIAHVELEGLEDLHTTVYNVVKNSKGKYIAKKQMSTTHQNAGNWSGIKNEYQFNVFGSNGYVTNIFTGDQAALKMQKAGFVVEKFTSNESTMQTVKKAYKHMTTSNDYRIRNFRETATNYVTAVATAPLSGGFAITKINKITPFIFAKQSFQTGLIKTGISGSAQYIINDGKVNTLGALSDGFLTNGVGAFTGSAFEATIDFNNIENSSTNSIFGNGNKSFSDFAIESTSSFTFGARNGYFGRYIDNLNADEPAKEIAKGLIETSNQLINNGVQKEAKNQID